MPAIEKDKAVIEEPEAPKTKELPHPPHHGELIPVTRPTHKELTPATDPGGT